LFLFVWTFSTPCICSSLLNYKHLHCCISYIISYISRIKCFLFLIIKSTTYTNSSSLFWNETLHVSDSSCVPHQEFFTLHTAMKYVIQVCRQLSSRIGMKLYMFRTIPLSIIRSFSLYTQQWEYVIQVCRQLSSRIGMKLYMFRTIPLSIIRNFSLYTQQWTLPLRFVVSFRAGSGCSILHPDPARKLSTNLK
jgi:hypothetical protein